MVDYDNVLVVSSDMMEYWCSANTMTISSGLIMGNTGATGASRRNIRANLFPQRNMKSNRPYIYKGPLQRLHKAGIAEVVFTDTFEVEDTAFRYGQAFVSYRSRYGRTTSALSILSQTGYNCEMDLIVRLILARPHYL